MRIVRGFILMSGIVGVTYAQGYQSPSNNSNDGGVSDEQLMDQATQYQQQMQQQNLSPTDAPQLSQQEQAFASQLSDVHRSVFSNVFSSAQRVEAMALANTQAQGIDGDQTSISPDEAVEIVIKNARQSDQDTQDDEQQGSASDNFTAPSSTSNAK